MVSNSLKPNYSSRFSEVKLAANAVVSMHIGQKTVENSAYIQFNAL